MKHCLNSVVMLLALGSASFAAYADAGLTISDATYTPSSGSIYANANNMVTGHSLSVTIENTGDVDLNPGDDNYSISLYGTKSIVLKTISLDKPLAVGASETFTYDNLEFSIQPLIDDNATASSFWSNISLRENVSNTTKSNIHIWCDIYKYSVDYRLVPMDANTEVSSLINFGFVTEATTVSYRLRATGSADLVVTSIELPEGFSVNVETPFTIPGLSSAASSSDCYKTIEITFTPSTPGTKTGVIKFNVEGADAKEYAMAASYVGPNSFVETFDNEAGSSYEPAGWVLGDNWSVAYNYTSSTDKYCLQHSSADDSSFAITPKLHFGADDAVTLQIAPRSYNSRLGIYYSTDRVNWIPAKIISSQTEEGAESFTSNYNSFGDYAISIPEGDWYIGFEGKYVYLNNLFGGEYATVGHDLMITSTTVPLSATVNNAWTTSFTVKNLIATAEAAGSYSADLYIDGVKVASAETPEIEGNGSATYSFNYTFHTTGEHTIYTQFTLGDIVLKSVETTVTVAAEAASNVIEVGSENRATDSRAPLYTNYNNSESQVVFTEEYLGKYGITPGTVITGLSFDATANDSKQIANTLSVWLKSVEATTISTSEPYDMSEEPPLYSEAGTLDIKSSSIPYELISVDFAAPYTYNGGSLLMVVRSNAKDYKSTKFYYDAELAENTIYKYKDDADDFLTASWTAQGGTPVTKFKVFVEPAHIAGTVTNAKGAPVENTTVTLTSGDVVYSSVTNLEGAYSIDVYQTDLTYTLTVDNENYPVYTAEVNFADGTPAGDIVLKNFSTSREFPLTVKVTNNAGVNLQGAPFTLVAERFSVTYPTSETVLDANGCATLNVYGGAQTLTIEVDGMKRVIRTFNVNKAATIEIALEENVQTPYGTSYILNHDIYTGTNNVVLNWNGDEAIFEDSFEDYEPFAVNFAPWTGIDVDNAPAVTMSGIYPNTGVVNYGQIINPMAVSPVWDPVEYPTLAARTGMQYAGFPATASGVANNDWLITPAITLTDDNVLRFSLKSADVGNARFTVGITTLDNPSANDFTIISEGNYLDVDYTEWKTYEISLADYAQKTVKIGFHCISAYGAFISQLDDVFVGRVAVKQNGKALRVAPRSAGNPNEKFTVILDGAVVGETEDYSFTLTDVAPGAHVAQIVAKYLNAQAEPAEIDFNINADDYVKTDFAVTTNNEVMPEDMTVVLASTTDEDAVYNIALTNGAASVASFPKGDYKVTLQQPYYNAYNSTVTIAEAGTVAITLEETIVTPFNINVETSNNGNEATAVVSWNRYYGFSDSFETYDDFATGSFGGWTTINNNTEPSYPIGLGSTSNIVSFPGASTSTNPASVPPMVFNPNATTPAMTVDTAVAAPTGVKTILFQGPQNAVADKWLISPQISIREGYTLSLLAKAYSIYPETMQLCIATNGGKEPADFTVLDAVQPPYEQWTEYTVALDDYVGQDAYLAVHCTSNDGFILQIDDFTVGREGGEDASQVGYVKSYDVTLNGVDQANTTDNELTIEHLLPGDYTVGVRANYASGASEVATYNFSIDQFDSLSAVTTADITVRGGNGEIHITAPAAGAAASSTNGSTSGTLVATVYSAAGATVATAAVNGDTTIAVAPGIYLVAVNNTVTKVTVK
jgi:hypothetical protein